MSATERVCAAEKYTISVQQHIYTSVQNLLNETNVAVSTMSLLQSQSLVDFLQITDQATYTKAHRHMIGMLQVHTNLTGHILKQVVSIDQTDNCVVAALYAVRTADQKMLAVRNNSGTFTAQIGDGSCLRSYAVTVGATALATTVDYTTVTASDCSFAVTAQSWYIVGSSASSTKWTGLYWNAANTPSLAATISASSSTGARVQ